VFLFLNSSQKITLIAIEIQENAAIGSHSLSKKQIETKCKKSVECQYGGKK